jgi:hypothetical protein
VLIAIVLVNNRRRRAHELPASKSPIKNPPRARRVGLGVGGSRSRSGWWCETETDKAIYAVYALFGELAESGC